MKYVANTRTKKIASNNHTLYYAQGYYWVMLLLAVNNSVVLDRKAKNKKLITHNCLYV